MTVTAVLDLKQAEQDHAAAAAAVEMTEAQIAAGGRGISFEKPHALRDRARHAALIARGARERAERDQIAVRLAALRHSASRRTAWPPRTETAFPKHFRTSRTPSPGSGPWRANGTPTWAL